MCERSLIKSRALLLNPVYVASEIPRFDRRGLCIGLDQSATKLKIRSTKIFLSNIKDPVRIVLRFDPSEFVMLISLPWHSVAVSTTLHISTFMST